MDKIDRQILEFLLQDARTPFSGIANHLGLCVDTVSKRYAKMKQMRIIRSATLFLDFSKLGAGLVACLSITAESGHCSEIEVKLRDIEEVFLTGKTFGAFDIFALAAVADLESLDELRDRVLGIRQVEGCEVSIFTTGLNFISSNQLPKSMRAWQ